MKFKVNGVKFKFKKLPNGLHIGETPVTQEQWMAVMSNNPSYFKGKKHPVESVSWNDTQEFTKQLSGITGYTFRLPMETEWEYACRTGSTTEFNTGDTITKEQANFDSKSTTKVKSYPPNSWGLYDMHGNVWEWCQDWWDDKQKYRVVRGGCFDNNEVNLRCAVRNRFVPELRDFGIGFRVVRPAESW